MSIQRRIDSNFSCSTDLSFISAYSCKLLVREVYPEHSRWTKQEFADECDINTIMAKYMSTGELPQVNSQHPQFMDCTGHDFRVHMDFILEAQDMFSQLPSKLRDRFGNDPAEFLDFVSDPDNRHEMASLGLLSDDAAARYLGKGEILKSPPAPSEAPPDAS